MNYSKLFKTILLFSIFTFSTLQSIASDTNKVVTNTNDTVIELPGPYFNTLANNVSYKLKIKRFIVVPENLNDEFSINKKLNFFEPYYNGQPFSSGMGNFVYINVGQDIANINPDKFETYINNDKPVYYPSNQIISLPSSIIYYLNNYKLTKNGKIDLNQLSSEQIQKIIKPFYFSKKEVSVKEYKEFLNWVLQTNGYNTLTYNIVKYKTVSKLNSSDTLTDERLVWKIDRNKAYNYSFFDSSKQDICIAPIDSIELYFPKKNSANPYYSVNPIYFSDYKNSQYPVMGVNYYQALAFLDWKQHFHQKYLNDIGINYDVEYTLPSLIEYEQATGYNNSSNWLCELQFTKTAAKTELDKLLDNKVLSSNYSLQKNFLFENSITNVSLKNLNSTYKNDKRYATKYNHILQNGIEWLDGNVSEWLSDNYAINWDNIYSLHKNMLKTSDDNMLSSKIEDYYDNKNDKNGYLVVGANYLDYRESMVYTNVNDVKTQVNKAGIFLKRFVNPKTQYSTIGFRYVVKIKEKEELHKDSLLKIVGTYNYDRYNDYPTNYKKYFKKIVIDSSFYESDTLNKWNIKVSVKNIRLININEVTNGIWRKFIINLIDSNKVDLAKKYLPKDSLWEQYNDNYLYYFKDLKYDNLPVVNISYEAVNEFNKWMTQTYINTNFVSEINLPTKKEWEYFAKEYLKKSGLSSKMLDYKLQNIANINTSFYDKISKYINDSLYTYTTSDELHLKYGDLPEKYSKQLYEQSSKLIKYKKFLTKYFTYHKYPYLTNKSQPNLLGINKLIGNVSEIIDTNNIVMGGSCNSYFNKINNNLSEQWNNEPSPFVGFRQKMELPQKVDSLIFAKIMSRIPPGTVLLNKNFGVDVLEMRNIDYLGFINIIKNRYGVNSPEYKEVLPDESVWNSYIVDGIDLSKEYFTNRTFYNNPLVGVTYEQAVLYSQWRTEYINSLYKLYHLKYPRSIDVPKRVTYRLPTPEEWDNILTLDSIYMPDEGMIKPDFTPPVAKKENAVNTRISKGLTSSVYYYWRNKIGIYAFDDNVSEMTSEKGVARGCNWTGGKENTNCHYQKPTNWVGFRCVVDVEY